MKELTAKLSMCVSTKGKQLERRAELETDEGLTRCALCVLNAFSAACTAPATMYEAMAEWKERVDCAACLLARA